MSINDSCYSSWSKTRQTAAVLRIVVRSVSKGKVNPHKDKLCENRFISELCINLVSVKWDPLTDVFSGVNTRVVERSCGPQIISTGI